MKNIRTVTLYSLILISAATLTCSKGGDNPPANPCNGVTVAVTGTTISTTSASATNGSISATATGGSGFTFSLNSGSFQASGNFTGLAAGSYTVTAKNSDGCTGTGQFSVAAGNICAGVNIVVSATTTQGTPCTTPANGSISVTASGSSGFTYSVNGGSFQASGNFTGLAPGNYTIVARDPNGCTGNGTATINAANAGTLFAAVKTVIQNNCASCHNNSQMEGGMNFTADCNIVTNKDRVKARAVDNNPSVMPPTGALSAADKNRITAWINAGGRYTD